MMLISTATASDASQQPGHESLLAQGKVSHSYIIHYHHVICNHGMIDAQMHELMQIVAPKMMAEWESLAYCMRYTPADVAAFSKDGKNLKECCRNLFNNWVTTGHDPKPKTYEILLKYIKKIDNLYAASEEIEKDLIEGKDK